MKFKVGVLRLDEVSKNGELGRESRRFEYKLSVPTGVLSEKRNSMQIRFIIEFRSFCLPSNFKQFPNLFDMYIYFLFISTLKK